MRYLGKVFFYALSIFLFLGFTVEYTYSVFIWKMNPIGACVVYGIYLQLISIFLIGLACWCACQKGVFFRNLILLCSAIILAIFMGTSVGFYCPVLAAPGLMTTTTDSLHRLVFWFPWAVWSLAGLYQLCNYPVWSAKQIGFQLITLGLCIWWSCVSDWSIYQVAAYLAKQWNLL